MYSLIVLEEAKQELIEATDYYEVKQKDLGERFLKAAIEHYKKIKKEYREILIKYFPFLIVYRIDESKNAVVVISVFHSKRHPKHKYNKE